MAPLRVANGYHHVRVGAKGALTVPRSTPRVVQGENAQTLPVSVHGIVG